MEYSNYLGSMITNDERRTREIKFRIAVAKTAFNKTTFHQKNGRKFKERVKFYIWSLALYGAEALTLREVDQNTLEGVKCGAGKG